MSTNIPPTSYLPNIKSLSTLKPEALQKYVEYLRELYNPPVRGSRRRSQRLCEKSGDHSESTSMSETQAIREDQFERKYALKWLTTLISQCELSSTDDFPVGQDTTQEALIENAAALLAVCSGTAAAGVISRTFVFGINSRDSNTSGIKEQTVSVRLTDVPLENRDYGSVGAQTWGGACVMAEMMAEGPQVFGLPVSPVSSPFRCLELGAGTGLVSLVAAKILETKLDSHPQSKGLEQVEVIATDYYPSVLANLDSNIKTNFPVSRNVDNFHIRATPLDWSKFPYEDSYPNGLDRPFDVVYGADIIYEKEHAAWIKSCLPKLLKKPSHMQPSPLFHLIIPLRPTHTAESSTIGRVFGWEKVDDDSVKRPDDGDDGELLIKYSETIICDAEHERDTELVEYAYYRIGWRV